MTRDILEKRVVLVTGKGGVGRTTLAAAIAMAGAAAGKQVILAEIGVPLADGPQKGVVPWSPLARIFGRESMPLEPTQVAPRLELTLLYARAGHERFLRTVLPVSALIKAAMGSRALGRLLDAAPSFNEMGVFYHFLELMRDARNELLVVDMPATGHTMALVTLPDILLRLMPTGPIADALREGQRHLHDPSTSGAYVVTLPETLPVTEAIELADGLRATRMPVAGVLLNRWVEDDFTPEERAALRPLLATRDFYGASRFGALEKARSEAERLARAAGAPVTRIQEVSAQGEALIRTLAERIV